MQSKKREYQLERLEILNRYDLKSIQELKDSIKSGLIPEHPGWEDLIELKNIEAELVELENDIRTLQES